MNLEELTGGINKPQGATWNNEVPKTSLIDTISRGVQNSGLSQNWSNEDTQRQLAYFLLHGIDWGQTKTIARNPDKYYERNPILGRHPSAGAVDKYFALTGLGHAGLSLLLSDPTYRKWFQNLTIGLEAGVTGNNKFNLGIGTDF